MEIKVKCSWAMISNKNHGTQVNKNLINNSNYCYYKNSNKLTNNKKIILPHNYKKTNDKIVIYNLQWVFKTNNVSNLNHYCLPIHNNNKIYMQCCNNYKKIKMAVIASNYSRFNNFIYYNYNNNNNNNKICRLHNNNSNITY